MNNHRHSLSLTISLIYITFNSNSGYVFLPIQTNWEGAQGICDSECNSHLASIHSESQYDDTKSIAESVFGGTTGIQFDDIWIGLTLEIIRQLFLD